MSFYYFPDLNRYFKDLYYRNQDWFKYRTSLTEKEEQRLFRAFLAMDKGLEEIRNVFLQKQKIAPPLSDARNRS